MCSHNSFVPTRKMVPCQRKSHKLLPSKEDSLVGKARCDQSEELQKDNAKKDLSLDEASSTSSSRSDNPAASIITPETSLKEVSKNTSVNDIGDEKLSRIQWYLLWRFMWYLKEMPVVFGENEMPDTFHMLRNFSLGSKYFVMDFK